MYTFTRIMQIETGVPAAMVIGQWTVESGKGLNIPIDEYTHETSNNMFGTMEFDLNKPHITILYNGQELHFKKFNSTKESVYVYYANILNGYKPYLKEDTLDGWLQTLDGRYNPGNLDYVNDVIAEIEWWGLK